MNINHTCSNTPVNAKEAKNSTSNGHQAEDVAFHLHDLWKKRHLANCHSVYVSSCVSALHF